MIVIANEEFATGLRLAGVKNTFAVNSRGDVEMAIKDIAKNEMIIATQRVLELYPEIEEFSNVVFFPDELHDFSNIKDLQRIARSAIGSEVEL